MSKFRRFITSAIGAAALATGVTVAAAPAAQAATAVSFCFQWNTGKAYSSQPVQLQYWNGTKWVPYRDGKTNASGCGTFSNTASNVHLQVQAHTVLNSGTTRTVWSGFTPSFANPGAGTAHVGTGVVRPVYSY